MKEKPKHISEKWEQLIKIIRLKIKCSAIFSPFEI